MIVTFYSYKGGAGRTQLLANVAAYLCFYEDKKVLMIDWDLEAPGLHFYFKKPRLKHKGLIDLFSDYCELVLKNIEVPEDTIEKKFKDKLSEYIVPDLELSASGKGRIDLMPAGLYDDSYTRKINTFDWVKFYETLDGGFFIELLKKYLKTQDYDYIFIDSRTGVSDYSGICNIQIPDANVMVVTPIEQNVVGSKKVTERIKNAEYIVENMKRYPIIFPLLSRLDPANNGQKAKWIKRFRGEIKESVGQIVKLALGISLDKDIGKQIDGIVDDYIAATLIEYQTDISYGEKILFDKSQKKIEITTIEHQYRNISRLLQIFDGYPPVDFKLLLFLSNQTGTINDFFKGILGVIESLKNSARMQNARKDFDSEEQSYKEIENIYQQLTNIHPKEYTPLLIDILYKLGESQKRTQKLDEAEDTYLKILKIYKKLSASSPQVYQPKVAKSLTDLADLQHKKASYGKAKKSYDDALTIYKALAQVSDQTYLLYVAQTFGKLAKLQSDKKELKEAEAYCKEALEIYRKLALVNEKMYLPYIATNLQTLGNLQKRLRKLNDAEINYKESLSIKEGLSDDSENSLRDIANVCHQLGILFYETKRYNESEEYFNKALEIMEKLSDDNAEFYLPKVADTLNNIATLHRDKYEYNKAETAYRKALEIKENFTIVNPTTKHKLAMTQASMAIFYKQHNIDEEKSLEFANSALENLEHESTPDTPQTRNSKELAHSVFEYWGVDIDIYREEKHDTN